MSFSSQVKEELEKHVSPTRHCQLGELAAMIHYCGQLTRGEGGRLQLEITTENPSVARKCFTMLNKTFKIETSMMEAECFQEKNRGVHTITIWKEPELMAIFQGIKLLDSKGVLHEIKGEVNPLVLKQTCCQRAFLRGAFLSIGSMSNPKKSYHLELVCHNAGQALQLQTLLQGFGLDAKVVLRKKYHVVYLKEGSNIVDFLNICEAHVSLMSLENLRILKEMRNSINRRVNCETANITKTVNAAARQVEDILFLQKNPGFSKLPPALRQMAEVRLEHPDAPLKELGEYLDPPVGKSGVNHRLRKLSELADFHRG